MKKRTFIIGSFILFFALTVPVNASEGKDLLLTGQTGINPELLEAAKDKLKEKTMQSGTLDVFDNASGQVRNLRLIELYDNVVEKEGKYLIIADYRDINTGDIVKVEIGMVSSEEDFVIGDLRIKNVKTTGEGADQAAKEYTDREIQAFMMDYIEKQGQFTDGKVMLFDKDSEKMRNLELTELKEEVRRMGIFYSSSSKFADADTGDILDIDISVENKKGTLKVQALRIRNVRKGLVGKDVSQ